MKRLIPLAVALGLGGCAHKQMTNQQLTRSALGVGAAVLITGAIVYAEYRSSPPELSPSAAIALPPK